MGGKSGNVCEIKWKCYKLVTMSLETDKSMMNKNITYVFSVTGVSINLPRFYVHRISLTSTTYDLKGY